MMAARPQQPNGGFSLIEMLISVGLMSMIFGALFTSILRTQALFDQTSSEHDINSRLARVSLILDRELRSASRESLSPDLTTPAGMPTVWTSSLQYQIVTEAGLSATRRIQWELDPTETADGLDDDGDGLIDEGRIVLIEDEGLGTQRRRVLVHGVSDFFASEVFDGDDDDGNGLEDELGFAVSLDGQTLTLHVSLEVDSPAGLLNRTQTITVRLHNT